MLLLQEPNRIYRDILLHVPWYLLSKSLPGPYFYFFLLAWPFSQSEPVYMAHGNGGPLGRQVHVSLATDWVHVHGHEWVRSMHARNLFL